MNKRKDYERLLSELKSSQNEDEVLDNITKIIKGFSSDYYKNDLYENPYFKTFIPEVKEIIKSELKQLKDNLKDEISGINDEIVKLNKTGITSDSESISKLKDLKTECIILIKELDDRIQDLKHL
jgi:hypothetical protein